MMYTTCFVGDDYIYIYIYIAEILRGDLSTSTGEWDRAIVPSIEQFQRNLVDYTLW